MIKTRRSPQFTATSVVANAVNLPVAHRFGGMPELAITDAQGLPATFGVLGEPEGCTTCVEGGVSL